MRGPRLGGGLLLAVLLSASACSPKVRVATEEPIVVNLNIKVEQEVRIKLDEEVAALVADERGQTQVSGRGLGEDVAGQLADSRDVDEAKARGAVGERPDGYLGVASGERGDAIVALLERVNDERREVYRELAQKYDVSREAVEVVAGERRIALARPGQPVMTADGAWITRE